MLRLLSARSRTCRFASIPRPTVLLRKFLARYRELSFSTGSRPSMSEMALDSR